MATSNVRPTKKEIKHVFKEIATEARWVLQFKKTDSQGFKQAMEDLIFSAELIVKIDFSLKELDQKVHLFWLNNYYKSDYPEAIGAIRYRLFPIKIFLDSYEKHQPAEYCRHPETFTFDDCLVFCKPCDNIVSWFACDKSPDNSCHFWKINAKEVLLSSGKLHKVQGDMFSESCYFCGQKQRGLTALNKGDSDE